MTLSKYRDSSSDDYNGRHVGTNIWVNIVEQIEELCSVNEIFSDQTIAGYVNDNLDAEDVYDTDKLEKWASDNGYVRKDE